MNSFGRVKKVITQRQAQRIMTENEIGKVVVGLHASDEVTKDTKGKTINFWFFLKFRFS